METVLKGVVRAERLQAPIDFIQAIISRVKPEYLKRRYMIDSWTTPETEALANQTQDEDEAERNQSHMLFLTKIARRMGKVLKGGEPDIRRIAVIVINDWQRGKLPYFVAPPQPVIEDQQTSESPVNTDDEGGDMDEDEDEDLKVEVLNEEADEDEDGEYMEEAQLVVDGDHDNEVCVCV